MSVLSGLVTIKTEPVISLPIDPDEVFEALENDKKAGTLQNTITNSAVKYHVSLEHSGYLEQIDPTGNTHLFKLYPRKFKTGKAQASTPTSLHRWVINVSSQVFTLTI